MAKKTTTKKTNTKKANTKKAATKKAPAKKKAATKAKPALAASERAMAAAAKKKGQGGALAATEKARKAAIADIDKNIAEGGESGKRDHEVPSAKEKANDANHAEWQAGKKGRGGKKPVTKKAASKKYAKAEAKSAKPKRVSLLDAAATILAGSKEPMAAKAIVEAVVERGLWKPGAGKTPAATLYAAMVREISKKGDAARFSKVDRGQFTAPNTAKKGA